MTTEQLRVVIIDDSKADVAVIRRFLTRPGEREFEIGIAHSGAAGIALLQEARPDCILLDYRLPDMTGLDILTRLRHDLQMHTVPVVMLTGSSDESLVVQALKHGAQDYLSKDNLSAENLLRAIFNSIEKIEVMRRLEDALLSRDEFLSIASHELKTPLTTMTLQLQIGLQLMEGAYGNRERHDKARAIFVRADTQLKRISRLVEDLLDVSRIRAGRLELNDEELDLTALVHGTVERMSETFASASCELLLESQGPVVGKFDRFRLEQVVVNLVMNAIKYASRHPVHIGVLAVEGQAVISVRDEGPGINLEQQRTLFERFDRGSAPKGTPGLGLGLYIVRQIVAAHGGTIGVESQEGRGCVFTVRLPLRRAG